MSQITLIILILAIGFSCTKSHPINSTRDGEDSGTDLKNLLTEPANTTYATNSTLTRKELNSTIQPERNDEGSAIRKIMASKKDENITGQSEINTSAKSQPINSTRDGEDSGTDLKNLLTEPANTTYATNSTLTRKELNSTIQPERNDEGSAIRKIMASKKDENITGQSEINTSAKSQPINSTRDGEDSGTDLKNLLTEPANTTYATNSTLTRKELNSTIQPERNDEGSAIRKIMASKKDENITGQSEINTSAKSQPINSTRDGEDSGTDLKNLLTEPANTTYATNSTLTRKELNSTIQPERNDEGSAIRKIMASKKDENITGQSEINTSAKSQPINSTRDGEDSGTDLKNLLTEPANTTYATNSTLTRKELNSTIQPERNDEGSAIRKIMASKKDENITGQSEINTSAKSQPINSTRDGEDSGTDLKNLLTEPANTTYATNSTLTRKELNSTIQPERNDEGSAIRKIMASKKDENITGQSEINTSAKSQPINSTRDGEDSGTDLKNLLTEPANTTYATNSTLTRKELNSTIQPERNDEGSAIRKIMASKKDENITGQSEINTSAKSQPINSTRDGEDSGTDLKNLLTEPANTTYATNSTLTRKELNSTIQPERNDEGSAIRKIMASKKDENITGQSEINTSAKSQPINSTRDGEDSGTDLKNLLTEPANTTYATNSTLTRKELNSTIQPERNDEGSAIRKIMASKKDENITGQSEINTSAKSQPINSTRDGEDSGTDLKNLLTEPANTTYATNSTLTRKELNSTIQPERNDEGSAIRKIMASKKDENITGQSEINTSAKSQPINSTRDGEDSGTDLKNLLTDPANTTYVTNSTLTRKELNSTIQPERNDEGSAIRKIMASKKDENITGQSEINTSAKSQPINSTRDGEDSGTDLKVKTSYSKLFHTSIDDLNN
ncbi:uncharacterized protein LOC128669046 [Microplitis demolitor]|uniref:uncharacterized protein LOC128669046 n=1 Tax=Microplitis demolitor TaxID=69319 RepID=UPI00235B6995|nr:uncharacterized protein LOC128669046 [Microplitis demolitor]